MDCGLTNQRLAIDDRGVKHPSQSREQDSLKDSIDLPNPSYCCCEIPAGTAREYVEYTALTQLEHGRSALCQIIFLGFTSESTIFHWSLLSRLVRL